MINFFGNYKKEKNTKLGFCVLDFDILDFRFLNFLLEIKEKVDILIVGIKEDFSSFIPFYDKQKILEEIFFINYVLDFPIFYIQDVIDILKPDFYLSNPVEYKNEIYGLILKKNENR